MGYMRHHAIVVSSWSGEDTRKAHKHAMDIFPLVSEILTTNINGYHSFFIPTDGSKEGWDESDLGDDRRDSFIKWINSQRYEDGSSSLDWVEVQYGDDNKQTIIVRDSDHVGINLPPGTPKETDKSNV